MYAVSNYGEPSSFLYDTQRGFQGFGLEKLTDQLKDEDLCAVV